MAFLKISNLAKHFGARHEVLRDVSFGVERGALIAVLGASGGGKTTLLRLIAGFERPDVGSIVLDGEMLAGPGVFRRPELRGIGYVAQEGALFPHLNVADNITFGLKRAERRARHRVAELLQLVDLPAAYADRAAQTLSGGEQQRVALARALAPAPKLVLLDEPFSALDAGLRAETRAAVAAALAAAGTTAILVTHDQAEALSMGAQVGVLQNGSMTQLLAPELLYRAPASPELADFIGEALFAPGMAKDGHASSAFGRLCLAPGAPDGAVELMIRPEQIKISADGAGVPAKVASVAFYGHDAVVELALLDSALLDSPQRGRAQRVAARVFSQVAPLAGQDVLVRVEGQVVAYPAKHEA